MQKTYFIHTYGCQMNVHESEQLAGMLFQRGYVATDKPEECDVMVFNTCCVRETAETKILGNLGIAKKMKEKKPNMIIAVCGCMAQKEGNAQMLKKRCPFINIIFGTHNLSEFGSYLDSFNGKRILDIWDKEKEISENIPVLRTSGVNGWVNIMYGCNNFCSYCIVPYVRGRERSRDPKQIVTEVKQLVDEGYKEITLLGQNVNSYGLGTNTNFASLLSSLAEIDGKFRIKFMTSHPKDLSEDVVKVIASTDKLADYIHLPVQAGSDRILSMMNRKYTQKQYLDTIDMIRKHIPNVGLSSDIMVGFPTETEEDYLETEKVVKTVGFNNLFTFIYSRRSGTPADKMEQIPYAVKQVRIKRLIDLQFEIGNKQALDCVGKTFEVICEEWKNGIAKGKSSCEKAITFESKDNVYGKFVNVEITNSKNNQLIGKIKE